MPAAPNGKIRVAILAPLVFPVPPKKQGGTEWIVYHQANGLGARGYHVTLFALKNSRTTARHVSINHPGLGTTKLPLALVEGSRRLRLEQTYITELISELLKRRHRYDVIFNHVRGGEILLPLSEILKVPVIHVLHLPIFKELADLFRRYHTPLVTISHNQQKVARDLNYLGTVSNCVDTNRFSLNPKPGKYLFTIGTIGEHKDPATAVQAAQKTGHRLILAGRLRDEAYFNAKIKPYLNRRIRYLGEIGLRRKISLYQNAKALIFPTIWSEPFGLVMIEAMACGTPVIATRHGAVPEVVKHGETGFIVDNLEEMVAAIGKIDTLSRVRCREWVMENFTVEHMLSGYEAIIHKVLKR